jgi:cysteine desulfurase/selenocysteine lyase
MAHAVKISRGKNPAAWRNDFPILHKDVAGQKIAYLDSAASAQKPRPVLEAMQGVMEDHYANIHRGLYYFSHRTTNEFEAARARVAQFLNAPSENEIVFTRNSTEAINIVAQCWAKYFLSAGDEIFLTEMEHHANIVPWQMLQAETGIEIRYIPITEEGALDLVRFEKMLRPETKFISITHVSNALGTINDVKKICDVGKDFYSGMIVMIDGSQGVVHQKVDVQDIGCDFYVFTGHKLYGPTGVGVLWGRYDLLESMPPYQGGGDMIEKVTFLETTFKKPPARFDAGTPAFVQVIGLAAAIEYVDAIGMDAILKREKEVMAYAQRKIEAIEGLTFYGTVPDNDKAGILSFTAEWGHASDVATILDQSGVAVRAGHHCCMPLLSILGVDATIRASLGLYSNEDDIDALVTGLRKAKDLLG